MSESFNSLPSFSDQAVSYAGQSSAYTEAVNSARFVKGFGIAALVYALSTVLGMAILSGGIGVGVGLFIFRYDTGNYYRYLGIAMIVLSIAGGLLPFGFFLGPLILSCAVLWKGVQVLRVLSKEGREDKDWPATRKRAILGSVASGFGTGITVILLLLSIVGALLMAAGKLQRIE